MGKRCQLVVDTTANPASAPAYLVDYIFRHVPDRVAGRLLGLCYGCACLNSCGYLWGEGVVRGEGAQAKARDKADGTRFNRRVVRGLGRGLGRFLPEKGSAQKVHQTALAVWRARGGPGR